MLFGYGRSSRPKLSSVSRTDCSYSTKKFNGQKCKNTYEKAIHDVVENMKRQLKRYKEKKASLLTILFLLIYK